VGIEAPANALVHCYVVNLAINGTTTVMLMWSFNARPFNDQAYTSKPAEAVQSWHAGVPAILGCDSVFRERKS